MDETDSTDLVVDAVQIMLFARSIGDTRTEYTDLGQISGMCAPPTFTETLQHFIADYPFRPKPGQAWIGSGASPTGTADRPAGNPTLHAEQHFEYLADIRPGDVLRATVRPGQTWRKIGRSGAMLFTERVTEFINQRDELVVRSTLVGVTVEADGDPAVVDG